MVPETEVTLGEHRYVIGRLDTFRQLHVARRLGTVVGAVLQTLTKGEGGASLGESLEPIMLALGRMSDDDVNYVVKSCLAVVSRRQGDSLAPVQTPGGQLMFEDITVSQLMQLSAKVMEAHRVGDFFTDLLSLAPQPRTAELPTSPSPTEKVG